MAIDPELLPREDESDDHLARAWIALQKIENHSDEYNALSWTFDRTRYLSEYLPRKTWRLILLIWSKDKSVRIMQILSAGMLEDLLANHGEEMIAFVEAEAKRDPSFAKLLGGVWKSGMSDDVWERVQKAWDRRGWDGIPEA